ncbi:MAG TPA: creatininase family protein [Longimicrobium sp.]
MTVAGRPYILAETSWKAVRQTRYDVAVLPWGATEAHNHHLPYSTDVIQADAVAAEAARIAWEAGARPIVLPAIPFGVQTGQRDIPLCINLNPSTQAAVLSDVVETVAGAGIERLLLLNAHGGNDFRAIIRELQPRTGVFLSTINWWNCVDPRPFFSAPGDHAGELETAVTMHLSPDLVLPLSEAGDGAERKANVAGLREGWAWAPRPWTRISADTGVGDPRAATIEKGAAFFGAVTERVGGFLVELARTPPGEMFG